MPWHKIEEIETPATAKDVGTTWQKIIFAVNRIWHITRAQVWVTVVLLVAVIGLFVRVEISNRRVASFRRDVHVICQIAQDFQDQFGNKQQYRCDNVGED